MRNASSFVGLCLALNGCVARVADVTDEPPSTGGSSSMAGNEPGGGASALAGSSLGGGAVSGTASAGGAYAGGGADAAAGTGTTGGMPADGDGDALGNGGTTVSSSGGGGSGGSGGSGTAGTSAGGPAPLGIDFSIWSLQLPTGSGTSPTTISPAKLVAGYSDPDFFHRATDAGQLYMDPESGISTPGSKHCRTEMREMNANGSAAGWSASATNSMTVSGKVLKVGGGNSGTVTVAQVFNNDDSIPLCELEYGTSIGGFKLLYEEAKGGSGGSVDLHTKVAMNERYTFKLSLTKGQLAVNINGKDVYTKTPSSSVVGNEFYFKAGNYDQNATAGAISKTPFTSVEIYDIAVVHR
jgi:hypothetical protein